MTELRHCGIIPEYLLRRLAAEEPELAPALEFALRDGQETRGRREILGTRWEGGTPPSPQGHPGSGPQGDDASELGQDESSSQEHPGDDRPSPARGFLSPQLRRAVEQAEHTAYPGLDVEAGPPDQTGPAPQRRVHDAQHGTGLPGLLVRGEGDPATGDVAVTEAYDGLGHTFAVLADQYGRDSLDGQGLPLVATVHYGRDYDNAFWDGRQMVFGDGDGVYFNRFTASLDVIAHELAHGLVQYSAGLTYVGQPGALNESVADVFGAVVTQWARDQDVHQADWLVGADLFTDRVQGEALRSMADPGTAYDDPVLGKDPQPGHMDAYVQLPHDAEHDNGGVHINSGIPNRAFYLFATSLGGRSWDRAGQVWFDTLTTRGLIPRDVDFAGFAAATFTAAEARYGAGSEVLGALRSAWEGVGVLESERPEPEPERALT